MYNVTIINQINNRIKVLYDNIKRHTNRKGEYYIAVCAKTTGSGTVVSDLI